MISPIYNEIIWALGAQDSVVGIDLSTTYPPEVKNVKTVGYHRALSAEGILSLQPTAVIHDNNIGPPQVVQQLQQLNIAMKTFSAKNDSIDGAKNLIREMGAYFHKESRAEELCNTLDAQRTASLEKVKQYSDHPRVTVIHFGRASNVYLVVGKGGGGDGVAVSQMIELAGGQMAVENAGMQRMESPEILAHANPDVILLTDYGYDRLGGSLDQIKALPHRGTETKYLQRLVWQSFLERRKSFSGEVSYAVIPAPPQLRCHSMRPARSSNKFLSGRSEEEVCGRSQRVITLRRALVARTPNGGRVQRPS